jgi:hypothetical protein
LSFSSIEEDVTIDEEGYIVFYGRFIQRKARDIKCRVKSDPRGHRIIGHATTDTGLAIICTCYTASR